VGNCFVINIFLRPGAMRGAVLGSVTAGVANHIGYGKSAFAKWAQKDIYNKAIAHGLS
jgi:hypothetical protein